MGLRFFTYCNWFIFLHLACPLWASNRVPIPDCAEWISGRDLEKVGIELHGGNRLKPTASSRLGQYLARTGAATRIHRFRSHGKIGPEVLVVAVGPESFPLFRELMGETFPNLIEQVGAPNFYADAHIHPPDVWHWFFRWMTHVYDYILPGGFRTTGEWRMPRHGATAPMILLSDNEVRRFHDYLTLTSEPLTELRLPQNIPGYNFPADGYCHHGNCTGFFFQAPLGDKTSRQVTVGGNHDQHGVGGRESKTATLQDYKVPPKHRKEAELLKRVWSPDLNERLIDLLGWDPGEALHSGGGWSAFGLLVKTKGDRVPFVAYYNSTHKELPEPADYDFYWEHLPAPNIRDVAAAANGEIWAVGGERISGGFQVHQWDGFEWRKFEGAGVRISADGQGEPWVINDLRRIYRGEGDHWVELPGHAIDIGVGPKGEAWIIGMWSMEGGFHIYRWQGTNWERVQGPGGKGAKRIAVGPNGQPWVVNDIGEIYERLSDGNWRQYPGPRAYDISVGSEGTPWIVGGHASIGGYNMYKWTGTEWKHYPGGGVNITVDRYGQAWHSNEGGDLYPGRKPYYQEHVFPEVTK